MAPRLLNHSTLQWHPAIASSNGTTSTPPKLAVTLPSPNHSTLQWHPAMAPRPLHPAMAPRCHVQCAKVVRRPPPLLEVRTPIAIAIWGMKSPLCPMSVPGSAGSAGSLLATMVVEMKILLLIRNWDAVSPNNFLDLSCSMLPKT